MAYPLKNSDMSVSNAIPGLVNVNRKLWKDLPFLNGKSHFFKGKSPLFNGKINYFDWAIFKSKLLAYQAVSWSMFNPVWFNVLFHTRLLVMKPKLPVWLTS